MKKLTVVSLALSVVTTIAVSSAMAASPFRVEVPFDFVVKDTALASGDYQVIVQDNGLVRLRSSDGNRSVTVFVSAVNDREAQATSQLVFLRTDLGVALTQVRIPSRRGGFELSSSGSDSRRISGPKDDDAMAIVVSAKDPSDS